MSDVRVAQLADHATFRAGYAFDSERFNEDGRGLPIVRIRDVLRGRTSTFYDGPYDDRFVVDSGDYLIGMDGEFNLGQWRGGRALLNQRVTKIVDTSRDLDIGYLTRFLAIELKRLEERTPSVTVKHLSTKTLNRMAIPLPPLSEQRRISRVLDGALTIRRGRVASLDTISALLKSRFIHGFGDLFRSRGSLRPLADVAEIQLGKMLDTKRDRGANPRPYLRNANVRWFGIDLSDLLLMDFEGDEIGRFALTSGDVLVCEGGEVGRAAVWRGELPECYFQKALHRVRVFPDKLNPDYLVYALWYMSTTGLLVAHTSQATFAHLTKERLSMLRVPVPTLKDQSSFARVVDCGRRLEARTCDYLQLVDSLFASLQHRAFNGML